MAVAAARRSSHRDENHFGVADRRFHVDSECEAALPHIAGHEIGQSGFVNRHFPAVERGYLLLIAIDAD